MSDLPKKNWVDDMNLLNVQLLPCITRRPQINCHPRTEVDQISARLLLHHPLKLWTRRPPHLQFEMYWNMTLLNPHQWISPSLNFRHQNKVQKNQALQPTMMETHQIPSRADASVMSVDVGCNQNGLMFHPSCSTTQAIMLSSLHLPTTKDITIITVTILSLLHSSSPITNR